jgi:hypothetical protein
MLFYGNNVAVKFKVSIDYAYITEYNIGTEEDPKFVKLSRSLSREKRVEYVELLKDFANVFS